jgi:hypothetical protein
MRQRLGNSFSLVVLSTVFGLGIIASGLIWRPFSNIGQLWSNPFQRTTRVASTGPAVLEQVQKLNRLESCRYNGQVIVRGDSSGSLPAWLVGDRLLFIGRGEVVAGIDFTQMRDEHVKVSDNSVVIQLPAAQIFSTHLNNKQSEVYERQTGIFGGPEKDLETKVRSEAEARIQEAALSNGILGTARNNAQEALRRQLTQLGFQDIRFS